MVSAKSSLTYTNCGKTDHLVKTYHSRKKEVPIVPIVTIKSTKLVAGTKIKPVKSRKNLFVIHV
jgi:hypothetical protein